VSIPHFFNHFIPIVLFERKTMGELLEKIFMLTLFHFGFIKTFSEASVKIGRRLKSVSLNSQKNNVYPQINEENANFYLRSFVRMN